MKFLPIIVTLFTASVLAQDGCGFPDGPDCVSLGEGNNGLEQFADDGCCLLPIRCGNGDGGERCERVAVNSNNNNNNGNGNNGRQGNNRNARLRRRRSSGSVSDGLH